MKLNRVSPLLEEFKCSSVRDKKGNIFHIVEIHRADLILHFAFENLTSCVDFVKCNLGNVYMFND